MKNSAKRYSNSAYKTKSICRECRFLFEINNPGLDVFHFDKKRSNNYLNPTNPVVFLAFFSMLVLLAKLQF